MKSGSTTGLLGTERHQPYYARVKVWEDPILHDELSLGVYQTEGSGLAVSVTAEVDGIRMTTLHNEVDRLEMAAFLDPDAAKAKRVLAALKERLGGMSSVEDDELTAVLVEHWISEYEREDS